MATHKTILDKGFIYLVDYMGNDASAVQAARVSYKGQKVIRSDKALIRYLMSHNHMTPFEMSTLKFHVKCPIFIARQWFRHRTMSFNEISGRYSILKDEFYIPKKSRLTKQSLINKQGSNDVVVKGSKPVLVSHSHSSFKVYNELLDMGLSKELARSTLPLNTYTEFYFSVNLRNAFHFLKLRLDNHAQYEIRMYAKEMLRIIKSKFPITTKAFLDYNVDTVQFNVIELNIIDQFTTNIENWDTEKIKKIMSNRELQELKNKLKRVLK